MNEPNRQVYIGMNGYVIQTNLQTYREYYKLIGWQILGRTPELPLKVEPQQQAEFRLV